MTAGVAVALLVLIVGAVGLTFDGRGLLRHTFAGRGSAVGIACALAAFARVNYVLFPSLYTEWFYTGDLLRFGSYLLFLVGAAREVEMYW